MSQKISTRTIFLTFGILAVSFLAAFYSFAWTEPSSAPPTGNVPTPVNVGLESQLKAGNLTVWALGVSAMGNALIVANGKVGIGTINPGEKLEVASGNIKVNTVIIKGDGTVSTNLNAAKLEGQDVKAIQEGAMYGSCIEETDSGQAGPLGIGGTLSSFSCSAYPPTSCPVATNRCTCPQNYNLVATGAYPAGFHLDTVTPRSLKTYFSCQKYTATDSIRYNLYVNFLTFVPAGNNYAAQYAAGDYSMGTVASNSSGINCGANGADCSESYPAGSMVTLTARPSLGHMFVQWVGGTCSGSRDLSCTITMIGGSKTETAAFIRVDNIVVRVIGQGAVSSTVTGGINCGADSICSKSYPGGVSLSFTAQSAAGPTCRSDGSVFDSWGGNCVVSANNLCTITSRDNQQTEAVAFFRFAPAVPPCESND